MGFWKDVTKAVTNPASVIPGLDKNAQSNINTALGALNPVQGYATMMGGAPGSGGVQGDIFKAANPGMRLPSALGKGMSGDWGGATSDLMRGDIATNPGGYLFSKMYGNNPDSPEFQRLANLSNAPEALLGAEKYRETGYDPILQEVTTDLPTLDMEGIQREQQEASELAKQRRSTQEEMAEAMRKQTARQAAEQLSKARGALGVSGGSATAQGRAAGDIMGSAQRSSQEIGSDLARYQQELQRELEKTQRDIQKMYENQFKTEKDLAKAGRTATTQQTMDDLGTLAAMLI